MPDAEACMEACCRDTSCEVHPDVAYRPESAASNMCSSQVWQFNPMFACYRGKSSVCMRSGEAQLQRGGVVE